MYDIYNKRVAKYRRFVDLTQKEVAERLGMKSSTYSQLERKGRIGVEQLIKIAEILGVDISLLLYDEKKPNYIEKEIKPEEEKLSDIITFGQEPRLPIIDAPPKKPIIDEPLTITKMEESYIKILRKLKKDDRDEVIDLLEQKHKEQINKK